MYKLELSSHTEDYHDFLYKILPDWIYMYISMYTYGKKKCYRFMFGIDIIFGDDTTKFK